MKFDTTIILMQNPSHPAAHTWPRHNTFANVGMRCLTGRNLQKEDQRECVCGSIHHRLSFRTPPQIPQCFQTVRLYRRTSPQGERRRHHKLKLICTYHSAHSFFSAHVPQSIVLQLLLTYTVHPYNVLQPLLWRVDARPTSTPRWINDNTLWKHCWPCVQARTSSDDNLQHGINILSTDRNHYRLLSTLLFNQLVPCWR